MTTVLAPPVERTAPSPGDSRMRKLVVAHLIAGALCFFVGFGGTLYAFVVLFEVGRRLVRSRRIEDAMVSMAYVAAAEVIWRMSHARIPWETGKYVVVIVCIVTLVRHHWSSFAAPPVVFLLLLAPSVATTVIAYGPGGSRELLASYLLGPITLGLAALLCTSVTATRAALVNTVWALFLPTLVVATYQTLTIATAQNLVFGNDSNNMAAGNFGANQVATTLSIGLLAVFLLLVVLDERRYRGILLAGGAWFVVGSLLTFSRGGLVSFGVAALLASIQVVSDIRRLLRAIVVAGLIVIALAAVIIPQLDSFTGGFLSQRFTDSSTTHRGTIAVGDFEIFKAHPWVGVGVGMAPSVRMENGAASHTEYTRLLAEHGILGVVAIGMMVAMAIGAVVRARGRPARAWALSFLVWSLLSMMHADMRVAAMGLLFGFGCLTWPPSEQPKLA